MGTPDRTAWGELLMGRRLHVTDSRPGTTHGAYAHHVSVDRGLSACSGVLLDTDGSTFPLSALAADQRCRRQPCYRLWNAETPAS